MDPLFFATEGELWEWFKYQSQDLKEVWVGLYKKATRIPSVTIRQVFDAALCFGWSESMMVSVDSRSFAIRLTPRIPNGPWTPGTVKRYAELEAMGMIESSGRAAWENRDVAATEHFLTEYENRALAPGYHAELEANEDALAYWESQPERYRKMAMRWIMQAKKEETRDKRFAILLECCLKEERIPEYEKYQK
jgi:uncharacterized protein YdeI (YjbR/CyaY-like superfamily)